VRAGVGVTPRDRFATTRWTLVNAAGRQSDPEAAEALAELCQMYWPPLYGYLRGRGCTPDEAQDLTQGFFARFLERRSIRAADQTRGRFRAFLLTVLKRYVINERERATAARRGGRHLHLNLDFEDAERTYVLERRDEDTPEKVFDRKWAAITLERALHRLRDEYEVAGKGAEAAALMPYLTETGDLPSYKTVAEALDSTEGAVKVEVHRLRQRFGTILRLQVGETVTSPEDVDDEVRALIRAIVV
jgi:RNA polymerase sigma factor (sigma-70 family)